MYLVQRESDEIVANTLDGRSIKGGALTPVYIADGKLSDVTLSGNVNVDDISRVGSASDISTPGANTAAVVTYNAVAGERHVITGVAWSYDGGAPTTGNISITDGGNTIFSVDITSEGTGFIPFPKPKSGRVGQTMIITLAASAAITGKLSILNHWTE